MLSLSVLVVSTIIYIEIGEKFNTPIGRDFKTLESAVSYCYFHETNLPYEMIPMVQNRLRG